MHVINVQKCFDKFSADEVQSKLKNLQKQPDLGQIKFIFWPSK